MKPDDDGLGPWHLAMTLLQQASEAVVDVAVLMSNHATEPRAAYRYLTTALLLMERCRERERLARNRLGQEG